MKAKLPPGLRFRTAKDLLRIGKNNDGGYLISSKDINRTDFLISLGINDDWSFEEDFLKRKKVPLWAFDGSISFKKFFANIFIFMIRIDKPFAFLGKARTFFSYIRFFRSQKKHFKKFISSDLKVNQRFNDLNYITLDKIFKDSKYENIFLKIDIEGSEYRILDDILKNENRIIGLAIEFHDCDINIKRILDFVEKFSLKIIHIHANNCGFISGKNDIPQALELIFSKNAELINKALLPHPLDMPCDENLDEIILELE